MAIIDHAYSKEYGYIITATYAKELFEEGIINDQRAFECCGKGCTAQITCCNMTKPRNEMKRRVHFVIYGKHSDNCSEILEDDFQHKKIIKRIKKEDSEVGNTFKFLNVRPQRADTHKKNMIQSDIEAQDHKNRIKDEYSKNPNKIKRSICNLDILIPEFLKARKDNNLNIKKVELHFYEKIYKYSFSEFFCRINLINVSEITRYHFCYYGEAIIQRYKNGYRVEFQERFLDANDNMNVKCIITNEIIQKKIQRNPVIEILDNLLGREIFCFLFGKCNIKENIAYINIESLDHIACTEENIITDEGIE